MGDGVERDYLGKRGRLHLWTLGLRGPKMNGWLRLVGIGALGVLLIVAAPLFSPRDAGPGPTEETGPAPSSRGAEGSLTAIERELAREAEQVLGSVAWAGRVVVSVRLKTGPTYRYIDNRNSTQRKTEERDTAGGTRTITETVESYQPVIARKLQGGEESPVVSGVQREEVDGVVVVAEGAFDSRVRADLFRAAQIMFGVPAYRVTVLPMKAGE